ncbi:MAG: hypothetical protein AAF590_14145 [Pseudomonadota bacterium]
MGSGWRLPAGEVEALVARAIQQHLKRHIGGWLSAFGDPEIQRSAHEKLNDTFRMLPTVSCVRLGDGVLSIDLDADKIGDALDVENANIGEQMLSFSTPFFKRRRGVETKFVMVDQGAQPDQTLVINVAKALAWLDQIKKGASFDEIANSEKTTKKRVQQMMNFAFLAPDFARDILAGKQPVGLTSTWCMTHDLPLCWKEQRALIASL